MYRPYAAHWGIARRKKLSKQGCLHFVCSELFTHSLDYDSFGKEELIVLLTQRDEQQQASLKREKELRRAIVRKDGQLEQLRNVNSTLRSCL